MPTLTPIQIFILIQTGELDESSAYNILVTFFENNDYETIKVEITKLLHKITIVNEDDYQFLGEFPAGPSAVRVAMTKIVIKDYLNNDDEGKKRATRLKTSGIFLLMILKCLERIKDKGEELIELMEEIVGENYLESGILPREALGLGIIELLTGFNIANDGIEPMDHFAHTGFIAKKNHIIRLMISNINYERADYLYLFPKLEELYILNSELKEIKGLETLTNLKALTIMGSKIKEIEGLENLRNLEKLYLYSNQISEIKGLESLVNLEGLDLSHNNITEIKGLETLINLKKFKIFGNNIPEKTFKLIGGKNAQDFVNYCKQEKKYIHSQRTLRKIYEKYSNNKLDVDLFINDIKSFINNNDSQKLRIEAIEFIGKVKEKTEAILEFLSNLLQTDQNEFIEQSALKIIIESYLDKGEKVLLWAIKNVKSPDCLYTILRSLENNGGEKSLGLIQFMEEYIGKKYINYDSKYKYFDMYGGFNIVPEEALILGLLEMVIGDEFWKYAPYGDEEFCTSIEIDNGHIIGLYIRGARFREIKFLERFQYLKRLEISAVGLIEIKGLESLTNLENLNLCDNEITEIRGLDNLINLKNLNLAYNPITEIKGLDNLKNLKDVYFEDNQIPEKELDDFYNNFPPHWADLGEYYYKTHKYDKAIESFNRATNLDPKFKAAWYNLAKVYLELEQYDTALYACKRSLEIDNNYEEAIDLRKKILELKK